MNDLLIGLGVIVGSLAIAGVLLWLFTTLYNYVTNKETRVDRMKRAHLNQSMRERDDREAILDQIRCATSERRKQELWALYHSKQCEHGKLWDARVNEFVNLR